MTRGRLGRAGLALATATTATVLAWLVAEGAYAILKGPQAEVSLGYAFLADRLGDRHHGEVDPLDASTRMITSLADIRALLPLMVENGIGLGNSPYSELRTEAMSINSDAGECRVQKPNLRKTVGFLRTNLFNPFDQMTFFHDVGRKLPAEVRTFLDRYAFRRVSLTTNEFGERTTLPVVEAPRKVLIAGDSVANGAMLDDSETLASRLQAHDSGRRYINLGISGAKASDIVCALERAAQRYHGQIDDLVYVLCENDWSESEPYGQPEAIIEWIRAFREREAIPRITLMYMPYIYNTAPELTRLRGHMHYAFPTYHDEKHRMMALAHAAGFHVIDFLDIADEERARYGTQFASLALYLDHTHLSRLGVRRVLPRLVAATSGHTTAARRRRHRPS